MPKKKKKTKKTKTKKKKVGRPPKPKPRFTKAQLAQYRQLEKELMQDAEGLCKLQSKAAIRLQVRTIVEATKVIDDLQMRIDENAVTRDGHRAIGGLMGRRDKAMKILGLDKPAKKKVTL